MCRILLKKLRIENFKGFKEAEFDFYKRTKVSGANGLGKSTLAAAYMWLFWNIDYNLSSNPNVRRKIDRQPVNDVPVSVEATLDMDGTEVTAKKVQKRSFKKDGSFSDDNTYFINDAPKTLRDFNEYFGFDMDVFKLCSNVNAFLNQKPKEMREFLFGLVEDVSDLDVARKYEELVDLEPLLEKYTVEELSAMNKASITKITKEQNGIPAAIAENKRYLVDDIDTAELELQRNALQEKIAGIKTQLEDSEKARAEWKKKSDNIMELQFKKSDLERAATDKLKEERRSVQAAIDAAEDGFNSAVRAHNDAERQIKDLEQENQRKENQKANLLAKWRVEKAAVFNEITQNDLLCPTCGQPLPEKLKEQKIASYEKDKEAFEKEKQKILQNISVSGNKLNEEIRANNEKIADLQSVIQQAKDDKMKYNSEKSAAMERLNKLPESPDMSENQEYLALCREIETKEEALRSENSGSNYRMALNGQLEETQRELDAVKGKLSSVMRNAEFEQRIADLEASRQTLEQKKADCEKVLDLLDKLDEKKNSLLVDEINAHFRYVKWDLFSRAKNGSYKKDYCKPVIDGKDYGDDTNTGLEILARLDIAMAAQRATGIYCPIFLDYGESIDSWRIPECESQLIVLCRTDDRELKIEEVA